MQRRMRFELLFAHGTHVYRHSALRFACSLVVFALLLLLAHSAAAAARNDGCELTWTLAPNPDLGGKPFSLTELAGLSPTSVWAVGSLTENALTNNLVAHWNGASWENLPVPNVSDQNNALSDVSVVAEDDVWALGVDLLHWNGAQWETLSRPAGQFDLTAFGGNDVWLTGSGIWHWDGAQWNAVPLPPMPNEYTYVTDIVVRSDQELWALASSPFPAGSYLYQSDGVTWTPVSAADGYRLGTLFVLSPTDIWAGGDDGCFEKCSHGVAAHWDGASWQFYLVTNDSYAYAAGVTAVDGKSTNDLWALTDVVEGVISNEHYGLRHWDGSGWGSRSTPVNGTKVTFSDLSVVAPDEVWILAHDKQAPILLHGGLPCASLPTKVVLVSPKDDATVTQQSVTLKWRRVAGTNYYQLQLSPLGKPFTYPYFVYHKHFHSRLAEDGTTYKWRVRACNNVGCGKWSARRTFKIDLP